MAYLYRHIRLDTNQPFYIGIGKEDNGIFTRAYSHKNRNTYWNNIVNKTEFKVQIILDDLTWEEACEKEKEFIKLYGKTTVKGLLCNIADGGQGGSLGEEVNLKRKTSLLNHFVSEETKNKIRQKALGRKTSEEARKKMSLTHKENKTGSWLKSKGADNGRAYPVHQYSLSGEFLKTWNCAKDAINYYNINKTGITDCLNRRQKTCKGFIWKKDLI